MLDFDYGPAEQDMIHIPLRNGEVIVRIHGIPWDLRKREADRIARYIVALAQQRDDDAV